METLTTAEGAQAAGVSVRQFHGYANTIGITPVRQLPGPRGAKFWRPADVRKVRKHAEALTERRAS